MDYPGKVITKTQVTPTQTSASGNWTLDDQAAAIKNNNWPIAGVPNPISKSLRFNSADSASLTRTFGTPTSRTTWTMNLWFKRSTLGTTQYIFHSRDAGNTVSFECLLNTTDNLIVRDYSGSAYNSNYVTTQVFRDPSAWYVLTVKWDTTNATAANRCMIFINGIQITAFSTSSAPSQNLQSQWNVSGYLHSIGSFYNVASYYNGYLTEINFIDGQALTPSDFGLTNPQTGQWIPKKYTGTYGTNGFYLNFKDATSTTTLGYDYSGNANNWTTTGFVVSPVASANNDSLTDVPTPWVAYNTTGDVGGVFRGNYAVLNPLKILTNAPTNGNLSLGTTTYSYGQSTFTNPTGKVYVEATVTGGSATNSNVFVRPINAVLSVITDVNANNTVYYRGDGGLYLNGSSVLTYTTYAASDVIGVALDNSVSPPTVRFYKNNVAQGSSAYTLPAVTTTGEFCIGGIGNGAGFEFNFGQRPFAYTPPAGFRSLCTTNLPATAIGFGLTNQGDDYINAVLYSGNSGSQSITGVGFQPDLVWGKSRNIAENHGLFDAVRGVNKILYSNLTNAEATDPGVSAFNSDGFSLNGSTINATGYTYVAWNWKANGAGVTNTAGQITSTVSANNDAGFSIVTYTGNGSANQTVGHGCKVGGVATAPAFGILKDRDPNSNNSQWQVFHTAAGDKYAYLSTTAAFTGTAEFYPTSGSSTTVTIARGSPAATTNESGDRYVMYLFAPVPGYSAFGSYEANNAADGVFVYLGFRPKWIMFKRSSTGTNSWVILDSVRNTYNVTNNALYPNQNYPENGTIGTEPVDFLSNGFKIRTSNSEVNGTGTYVYAAFAESPFQFANAR